MAGFNSPVDFGANLSGAEPVYITEGGILVQMGPPDLAISFDDPKLPGLRQKQINEVAEGTFQLNGIKRYWAACDGKQCAVFGWGDN